MRWTPPRTPRRSTEAASALSRLGLLLDLLHRLLALQPRQVVDEQHPVQVVHLMLDADGEQALGVLLDRLAGVGLVADLHPRRPLDLVVDLRNRQAAFLIG